MDLPEVPRPRIGFVGRFEPVKGLDVLLAAFTCLASEASLVLVGDGSQRDMLHGERVHVLPAMDFERLPSLLKALDVLVLPSVTMLPMHREQFGRVLAEAMAAGVPVIGSTSGALPEVIEDAGLIVPERDAAALARALQSVLTDTELRRSLAERGLQRARAHFAWPRVAEQTLELFRSAVAHRRGVPELHAVSA
jgi:glycosyltransferase involved in cell wall biosynthesis